MDNNVLKLEDFKQQKYNNVVKLLQKFESDFVKKYLNKNIEDPCNLEDVSKFVTHLIVDLMEREGYCYICNDKVYITEKGMNYLNQNEEEK